MTAHDPMGDDSLPRRLVLASTSPYRRALLERLRLPFACASPHYPEEPLPGLSPEALVRAHAEGKARSLIGSFADALIIGSDQVMVLDEEIVGKPGSVERAVEQLQKMQGREHRLVTAVVVTDARSGACHFHTEVSTIGLRPLTDAEIRNYVDAERPLDCAGSYKSEALGIALFAYQRGDDPTAVVGLPLIGLGRLLRDCGVNPLS